LTAPKRSAGIVVVRLEGHDWQYLLLRAFRNWDFPKGLIEPGEDPLTTALREVKEEAGIDGHELTFRWGEGFQETEPYSGGKIARYYLAQTERETIFLPVSPELGKPEHHEWRWVTGREAEELLPPRLLPVLNWARRHLRPTRHA